MTKYYLKWERVGKETEEELFGKVKFIDEHVTTVEVERDDSGKLAPKDIDICFKSDMVDEDTYTVHIDSQILALMNGTDDIWFCEFKADGCMFQVNVTFDENDAIKFVNVQVWFNIKDYYADNAPDDEIEEVTILNGCEL